MKPSSITMIVLAVVCCGGAAAQTPAASIPRKVEELITITARVQAVDVAKREITIKGPLGNTSTYIVDPAVKRITEVKVGDRIQLDYYISMAAEIRKPTPEEEKQPLTIVDAGGKADQDAAPAVGGLRTIKVVATVEGLDRPTQTVTLKGPQGNFRTVRVADPAVLTGLTLDQKVVVTCTEAVAISLEKAEKGEQPAKEQIPGKKTN